jgi:hypothetical protein
VSPTSPDGPAVITRRIHQQLQEFDRNGELMPLISTQQCPMQPGQSPDQQIRAVTVTIEQALQSRNAYDEQVS